MNTNIEEMNHMLNLRKNVIHWYPMDKDSSVLQIGAVSKEILEELCNKVKKVVVIVETPLQKDTILKDFNKKNIEVKVIPNLELEDTIEQYDYVSLLHSLETYQNTIEKKAYKRLDILLKIATKKCKQNGKILVTVANKYAMKSWTTLNAQENILCNHDVALSKKMVNQLLENNNLHDYKYYYMLPDDNITNVIFTDTYMPNIESIHRNFTYGEEEFSNFNQTEAYTELLKEDKELFKLYANSYFIEIGKENLQDNGIQFVSYTNIRKKEYRIQTIIYQDRVEKTNMDEKAKEHIESIKRNIDIMNEIGLKTLDSYEQDKIVSRYIKNGQTYDKVLIEYLENEENEKFFRAIETYKENLLQKLEIQPLEKVKHNNILTKYEIDCEDSILEKFQFAKHGLWDLIFQNVFYINEDLYFYDQEWYEENIPIQYIIYRAIAYFSNAHAYIETKQLYEQLNLIEYIEVFQKLDSKIQETIRDEEMWNRHNKTKTGQTLLDLYHNLQKEFEEYKKQNQENEGLKEENQRLRTEMTQMKKEYKQLAHPIYSKIGKSIRWLRKK